MALTGLLGLFGIYLFLYQFIGAWKLVSIGARSLELQPGIILKGICLGLLATIPLWTSLLWHLYYDQYPMMAQFEWMGSLGLLLIGFFICLFPLMYWLKGDIRAFNAI